jgi:membrane associated rhomboid family serine protease/Tfp pilus assembly protein PilF
MANCVQCGRNLPALSFGKKICSWCVQHEAAQRGLEPENAVQRVEAAPWKRQQDSSGIVTKAIFGMNVAVFLGMLFAGVSIIDNPSGQDLVRWGANYGPLTLTGQWWRLVTYMFEHGSLIHIALNMWCLWNLGTMAESLYGRWTYVVVYLLCGVTGGLGSVIWHPNAPSVGASGAIFGIAGALIASFYLGEFSLPRAAINGTLRSVAAFVGYNLLFGAAISGVDNAAHIGGLIGGLILGAMIAKAAPDQDSPRRFGVLALALVLIAGGTAWWLHSRDYIRHMQRGAGLLGEGKTDQAITEFQIVLRSRPDFPPAHYLLGRAYAEKKDYDNAEAEFQRAIALNSKNENSYYNLGYAYLEQKKLPQARETFQRLLGVSPQSADAHFGLAAVSMVEQNYQLAIQEYQAAARLDPEMQGVHFNEGLAHAKLGQWDDAIASFKKETDKAGDDYDTEIALASAYEAKGMKQEAADYRKKAAALTGR